MPTNGNGEYRVWLVLDRDENERGDPEEEYHVAVREAKEIGGSVVELTYTFKDMETVENFAPRCERCDEVISEYDEMKSDYDGDHCRACQDEIAAEEAEEE